MANVKEKVLSLLAQEERYISGEELATRLGVTRSAVWKAVKSLETDGYVIEAVTNRGYMLMSDALTPEIVEKYLDGMVKPNCRVAVIGETESTNAVLRAEAHNGEKEGKVLIAAKQTSGRGRLGRDFFSPCGTGLYMSVLLRPQIASSESALITTAAAAATSLAIEELSGKATGIKWVNDILIDGKKVCGILTEGGLSLETGGFDWAVLGIGVNVYEPSGGFPDSLAIAGSVFGARNEISGRETTAKLAAMILNRFFGYYGFLTEKRFFDAYESRLTVKNREVTVVRGESERTALALGIDRDFRLTVRYEDGTEEAVQCGEISLKNIKGAQK